LFPRGDIRTGFNSKLPLLPHEIPKLLHFPRFTFSINNAVLCFLLVIYFKGSIITTPFRDSNNKVLKEILFTSSYMTFTKGPFLRLKIIRYGH